MSWSISASGKAADVADSVRKQLSAYTVPYPAEQALREKAVNLALAAVEANSAAASVGVSAYGSQTSRIDEKGETTAVQSVTVSISASLP